MSSSSSASTGVAVVGMACRLPGAASPREFWENLRNGVESIRRLTRDEMLGAGLDVSELDNPRHVPVGALVEGVESFDAGFFGFTAREAELLDPQHRLFLECAWQSLEDAGCDPARCEGAIAVFGGGIFGSYATNNLLPGGVFEDKRLTLQTVLSNEKDYMTSRVSYKLNLRGPSITVQTGLLDLARRDPPRVPEPARLASATWRSPAASPSDCPAGTGLLPPRGRACSRPTAIAARSTRRRRAPSSATAWAWSCSSGSTDALADGDTIHAVIHGVAVNNDGAARSASPRPAWRARPGHRRGARRSPASTADTIGYVEAHGTGTPLGDPIEIAALDAGVRARPTARPAVLRDRLGQEQHRPPRRGGGRRPA